MRRIKIAGLGLTSLVIAVGLATAGFTIANPSTMPEYMALLISIVSTASFVALILLIYCRYRIRGIDDEHSAYVAEYKKTQRFAALDSDQRQLFNEYILKNMYRAETKQLVFETIQNALPIIAGVFSILATAVDNPIVRRTATATAAQAALIMTTFNTAEYAMVHRRSNYLIHGLISKWLAGSGIFSGQNTDAAFAILVMQVEVLLDTTETSFIGVGSEQSSITVNAEKPTQLQSLTPTVIERPAVMDFPKWQQESLDAIGDEEDPITQGLEWK